MTNEQSFFIQALADHLNGKPTKIKEDLNWDKLTELAVNQQLAGILFSQIKDELSSVSEKNSSASRLSGIYAYSVYSYANRINVLRQINSAFQRENIPYLIFKGSEVAEHYPIPALRTMGDCDILVKRQDKEKADTVLSQLGLVRENSGPNEWIYNKNGLEYELHRRLMNEEASVSEKHRAFLEEYEKYTVAEENSCQHHLEMSYHFVFLLLHLRKHFINSGVGFRMFMDLAVINQKCDLNWDYIVNKTKELDVYNFLMYCLAFCEKAFCCKFPIETECISDQEFFESADMICNNGIFGHHDEDNKDNYAIYQLGSTDKKNTRIMLFLKNLFPPYRLISELEKYSFLKGRPYLLPIAWVYRYFYAITHRTAKEKISQAVSDMNISDLQVEKRMKTLKKWRLI